MVVEIAYLETVPYRDSRYTLRLPLAITPRYTPGAALDPGAPLAAANAALAATEDPDAWVNALVEAHKEGRIGRLQIERIDDEPARTSQHAPRLREAGFADGYKGLTLHK